MPKVHTPTAERPSIAQHGAGMPVIDWARLLRCTECDERGADFVVSGTLH